MQLFHGTRQRFEKFDVSFMGTGRPVRYPLAGLLTILKVRGTTPCVSITIPDRRLFISVVLNRGRLLPITANP